MPIDGNKVLNYQFKTIDFDWDADKVILYHLGVGAGADWLNPNELRYTFEKNLQVLPSYGVLPSFDAMPDIERCVARIRDQICRCGDAKQAKSELLHGRIFDARMIALSECREELIGAERKASDHIQFIKKEDEAFFNSREHDFTDGLEPALDRA